MNFSWGFGDLIKFIILRVIVRVYFERIYKSMQKVFLKKNVKTILTGFPKNISQIIFGKILNLKIN